MRVLHGAIQLKRVDWMNYCTYYDYGAVRFERDGVDCLRGRAEAYGSTGGEFATEREIER